MNQGDIYSVDLGAPPGHEQRGHRPVMIISLDDFNKINIPFIVPITSHGQSFIQKGFAVPLEGCSKTTGLVLCNQIRAVDLNARRAKFVEMAPPEVIEKVLQKLITFMVKP
jgi:mRNA interferase ChpB